LACLLLCLAASSTSAAIQPLLPPSLIEGHPDITTSEVSVIFDATSSGNGTLHASIADLSIQTLSEDGIPMNEVFIVDSFFDVFVTIDAGMATAGSLDIHGTLLDTNMDPVGAFSLLGDLSAFGQNLATGKFQFIFNNVTSRYQVSVLSLGSQLMPILVRRQTTIR
jgi:hypothetical protein